VFEAVVAILAQPAVNTAPEAISASRFRFEPVSRAKELPIMGVPSEEWWYGLLFKVDFVATSCADQRDNVKLRVRQAGEKEYRIARSKQKFY
jgi:hypothetical protein